MEAVITIQIETEDKDTRLDTIAFLEMMLPYIFNNVVVTYEFSEPHEIVAKNLLQ